MNNCNQIYVNSVDLLEFISSIPGGAMRCTGEGLFTVDYISDGMLKILECTREEFYRRYQGMLENLICKENVDLFRYLLSECSEKDGWKALEHRVYTYSGEFRWVVSRYKKIITQEFTEQYYIYVEDINDKKLENIRLVEQMRMDALTRLYNRKYTQNQIEKYLEQEGKNKKHLFMIISIDDFKNMNERVGTLFEESTLTNITNKLKNIFLKDGIVCRIGVDEFIIFIKQNRDLISISQKINEVKNIFESTYWGENLEISCSIGTANYPENGRTYQELFKSAGEQLYREKKQKDNSGVSGQKPELIRLRNDVDCRYMKHSLKVFDFNREIIEFFFEQMTVSQDASSAMKLFLEKAGVLFGGCTVGIIECSEEKDFFENFYEQGVLSIKDCTKLPQGLGLEALIMLTDTKSLLVCPYYEVNEFRGYVTIEEKEIFRYWTQEEINSIITVAKIVSFYLFKLKVSESMQEKLDQMLNYDDLTGLPSLQKFKSDADKIVNETPDSDYVIVYLDISNFKYINDSYGYDVGDRILNDFAIILSKNKWGMSIVTRVSADNFVVLLPFETEEKLWDYLRLINDEFYAIHRQNSINYNSVVVSGACVVPHEENGVMHAIDNANIARKSVKASSTTACKFYDEEMEKKQKQESEIISTMEDALVNREFLVYLQPKIGLQTDVIVGAEALVRWYKPNSCLLPPNDFIPLFEKNGFILKLDFYVYEEVCKLLARWRKEGKPVIPISVNVSRLHLNEDGFVEKVKALITKYELPPTLLELELTESLFLNNTEKAIATMNELRAYGFKVSIDDFGAGYSSLNLLKDMATETDILKIDKEFFGNADMQKEERIIVSSVIGMAKQLNMKVLSEGVETQLQSDFLKDISCDMAQGYLYAKPMPIDDFEVMLLQGRIKTI